MLGTGSILIVPIYRKVSMRVTNLVIHMTRLSNVYVYIRNELFNENCITELSQVAEIQKVRMNEFGVNEINTSTAKNQEKANH